MCRPGPASRSSLVLRLWPLGVASVLSVALGLAGGVRQPIRDALLRLDGRLIVPEEARVSARSTTQDSATATVTLRNLTAEPIRIVGASTTCSCIAATRSFPVMLEPHDTISIHFELTVPEDAKPGDPLGSARFFTESRSRVPQVEFLLGSGKL